MNSNYKEAFKFVAPDENSVERIFDMTTKRKISFKPLLIAVAVIVTAILSMFTVNAASDGKIADTIKKSEIYSDIKIFVNGEDKTNDESSKEIAEKLLENVKITHSGENDANYYCVVEVELNDNYDTYSISISDNTNADTVA